MNAKLTLISLFGLFITIPVFAAPTQWTVAEGGNDHWYEFVGTKATWNDAFTNANNATYAGFNGYLATVTSSAENNYVSQTVAGGVESWLGGSDEGNEGNWTWRNGPEIGQTLSYNNWLRGEPNNAGGENSLETNFFRNLGWNDARSNSKLPYIIEYSAPVPELETYLLMIGGLSVIGAWVKKQRSGAVA